MAALRFALRFKTHELSTLDVPVEIRRPNSSLIATTLSSKVVELPPGTYYVVARMPAGQRLVSVVQLGGTPQTVELQPDADDESPHESEEISHFMEVTSRRARGAIVSDALEHVTAPSAPRRAHVRVFSGNLLRGEARVEAAATVLSMTAQDPGRVQFACALSARPLVVQLVEPGVRASNMMVPVSPQRDALIVFSRREDGSVKMEAHVRHNVADLLLKYCGQGAFTRAAQTVQSDSLKAERLLEDKLADPLAAAIGAYALLRVANLDRLHNWTENLHRWFPWLADGAAIRAEHLARLGRHAEAAEVLFDVHTRGLPLFADGFFYAVERLKWYASLKPDKAQGLPLERIRATLADFQRFAGFLHRERPNSSFPGLDPVRPDMAMPPVDLAASDVLDLDTWLPMSPAR